MLRALRHHPVMVGTLEVLVDAARYIVIVLVVLLLMDSSRRLRFEAARANSERGGPRGAQARAVL